MKTDDNYDDGIRNTSEEFEIKDAWNAVYEMQDKGLLLTPEAYNREIPSNGSIRDIGIIIKGGGEITAEIDETDVMISETRDYVKKAELNQDKRDLLFEEHRLASRLSIVVKQIDELISKKDDGITR